MYNEQEGFVAVAVYLDDFFIYVHPRSRSVLLHFIGFIATLSVPYQLEQVIDPCQCIALMGIEIDTESMTKHC